MDRGAANELGSILWLCRDHWQRMLDDVVARFPNEACGIVAGRAGKSEDVFPVDNELESPIRYRMNPLQQLKVFNLMEEKNWNLLAIYHSHPEGPAFPSDTDIAEAYYPEAAHIIWTFRSGRWTCRAFFIRNGTAGEFSLLIG